jgi:hypothetical protein
MLAGEVQGAHHHQHYLCLECMAKLRSVWSLTKYVAWERVRIIIFVILVWRRIKHKTSLKIVRL